MRLSDLKEHMTVMLDKGFTCHKPGIVTVVQNKSRELGFVCNDGFHSFDGQVNGATKELIGVSPNPHREALALHIAQEILGRGPKNYANDIVGSLSEADFQEALVDMKAMLEEEDDEDE